MKRFCPLIIVFILSAAFYVLTGFALPEEFSLFGAAEDDLYAMDDDDDELYVAETQIAALETDAEPEIPVVRPGVSQTDAPEADTAADAEDSAVPEAPEADETQETQEAEETEPEAEELPVVHPGENTVIEVAPLPYTIGPVEPDYFVDALFIGDSRTVGLGEYCPELDANASFYAKVSLTVRQALDKPFVETAEGKKTVYEMLANDRQYGKIYIMLGINELGGGTNESFREDFREMIGRIRVLQPGAIIIVQGIMHVTGSKSARDPNINNERINGRNAALAELADPKMRIFYVDPNENLDDEEGNLRAELSFDDVHLKAASYGLWYEYLLGHGVIAGG